MEQLPDNCWQKKENVGITYCSLGSSQNLTTDAKDMLQVKQRISHFARLFCLTLFRLPTNNLNYYESPSPGKRYVPKPYAYPARLSSPKTTIIKKNPFRTVWHQGLLKNNSIIASVGST